MGDFFLAQSAAGQTSTSPAVDRGARTAVAAGVDAFTTRTDNVLDSGQVDLGFHYPASAPVLMMEPSALVFHADRAGVALPTRWFMLFSLSLIHISAPTRPY